MNNGPETRHHLPSDSHISDAHIWNQVMGTYCFTLIWKTKQPFTLQRVTQPDNILWKAESNFHILYFDYLKTNVAELLSRIKRGCAFILKSNLTTSKGSFCRLFCWLFGDKLATIMTHFIPNKCLVVSVVIGIPALLWWWIGAGEMEGRREGWGDGGREADRVI